ncbi:hypothetical protein NQ318_012850, partial [Aromia moschata]
MELRVGNKYRLGRKIGSGSFGDIHLGTKYIDWRGGGNQIRMYKDETSPAAHRIEILQDDAGW